MLCNRCQHRRNRGTRATLKERANPLSLPATAPSAWIQPASEAPTSSTPTNAFTRSIRIARTRREGVGKDGDWLIDFHQRFDYSDAARGCKLLEELEPYFIEDPVRADAFLEDIPKLRKITTVPISAGEEWGQRWDFNKLVENHDLDYIRATLPNVGGITEMMRVAAICETHNVGIVPHFTGPVSTAALIHTLGPFPGPVLFEYTFAGREIPYLPECMTFKNGKLWPNDRKGLGRHARPDQSGEGVGDHSGGERSHNLHPPRWLANELVMQERV